MVRVSRREFKRLVVEAMDSLPPHIKRRLDNVDVVVSDWPSREDLEQSETEDPGQLFGLYYGIPLTERDHYDMALPDRITVFRRPLEAACNTTAGVAEEIRVTVLHEVAHHFGIGDAELERTDYR